MEKMQHSIGSGDSDHQNMVVWNLSWYRISSILPRNVMKNPQKVQTIARYKKENEIHNFTSHDGGVSASGEFAGDGDVEVTSLLLAALTRDHPEFNHKEPIMI